MEINKSSFDKFVGEYRTESVKAIITFYKTCPLFYSLPDQKKVELSAKSFMIKYPTNTVVVKQNDIPYNIYFIASGSVRLVRRIKFADLSKVESTTVDSTNFIPQTLAEVGGMLVLFQNQEIN